jgi:hypothetical protein
VENCQPDKERAQRGAQKEDESMKRRFAILFAAALLVALASAFGVTACGGGAQKKVQQGKQKVGKKGQ